jgi:hypothetical protein
VPKKSITISPLAAQHHILVSCAFSVTGCEPIVAGLQHPVTKAHSIKHVKKYLFIIYSLIEKTTLYLKNINGKNTQVLLHFHLATTGLTSVEKLLLSNVSD